MKVVNGAVVSYFRWGSIVGAPLGALMTFMLFVFMSSLIWTEYPGPDVPTVKINENILMPKIEDPTKPIIDELEPIVLPPEELINQEWTDDTTGESYSLAIDLGEIAASESEISTDFALVQLKPEFKALPVYPTRAISRGIEGYVKVQFELSVNGEPFNILIIEAQPEGFFERSAKKAVAKWRYDPNAVRGSRTIVEKIEYKITE